MSRWLLVPAVLLTACREVTDPRLLAEGPPDAALAAKLPGGFPFSPITLGFASTAVGANGDVVGTDLSGAIRAVHWRAGILSTLRTHPSYVAPGTQYHAKAVNAVGQIAGYIYTPTGLVGAFWSSAAAAPVIFGTQGVLRSVTGISDAGVIVGSIDGFAEVPNRAFRWSLATGLRPLPSAGVPWFPMAVNAAGEVAGVSAQSRLVRTTVAGGYVDQILGRPFRITGILGNGTVTLFDSVQALIWTRQGSVSPQLDPATGLALGRAIAMVGPTGRVAWSRYALPNGSFSPYPVETAVTGGATVVLNTPTAQTKVVGMTSCGAVVTDNAVVPGVAVYWSKSALFGCDPPTPWP
ncbi:MAG: hypothetical protein IPK85_16840 [Gemmatimonadetes bacterium]|nr:hypothetical protein [Gemmatimonadota bacterium]